MGRCHFAPGGRIVDRKRGEAGNAAQVIRLLRYHPDDPALSFDRLRRILHSNARRVVHGREPLLRAWGKIHYYDASPTGSQSTAQAIPKREIFGIFANEAEFVKAQQTVSAEIEQKRSREKDLEEQAAAHRAAKEERLRKEAETQAHYAARIHMTVKTPRGVPFGPYFAAMAQQHANHIATQEGLAKSTPSFPSSAPVAQHPATSQSDVSSQQDTSRLSGTKRTKGGLGCYTKSALSRAFDSINAGDEVGGMRLLQTGLCIAIRPGADVFVDEVNTSDGTVRIRAAGDLRGVWIPIEMIE